MDPVRAHVAVWSEPNAGRRADLLRQCWTEQSEIIGPGYCFKGHQAVLDEAARFHRDQPGCRAVATIAFDRHGRWVRFTIAMVNPQGEVVQEWWDVVELDSDGRIARVITFWGRL